MPSNFADFVTDAAHDDAVIESWINGDEAAIRIQVKLDSTGKRDSFGLIISTGDEEVSEWWGFDLKALMHFCEALKSIPNRELPTKGTDNK